MKTPDYCGAIEEAVVRIDDLVDYIRGECAPSEAANALMRSALETRNDLAIMLNEARRGRGCGESGKEPAADFDRKD
jgi:hypothetical protein